MNPSLKTIQAPIAKELEYFDKYFRSAMSSDVALLDKITRFLLKRKGKQLRPMLVLFSAKVCGGITPSTYRGAALVELLHTATLVHDDVVDDSNERRGFFSINALWKNKIAVLIGDFLLSRGLLMALEHDDFVSLKIVSQAVKEMSEGELLQMEKARRLNIDEAVYLDIIRQKTASLFASCCQVGASSATTDPQLIENMRLFGELVGIAFQIKDDLFDYGTDDVGKPRAIDIKERKLTLPLIHVLNKSSWSERRKLINIVKNHNTDPQKVQYLIDFVKDNGGLDYSRTVMNQYIQDAENLLADFPDSDAKTALLELMRYAIVRKK
ncbi:polyprenyl synthetase family protein [Pontibacter sp. G13]|uniref:polyprenyl synthetase family protein n=1 Tax=Pontibacter sp. G13 TaxID=3074898 RepID=UPI00288B2500|nr:polyprenyl synthetase family protein [Pontibacter sp. G13]WNJ21448.1 polyprenyl synthetase family protein [Pontibacter sp. G13]